MRPELKFRLATAFLMSGGMSFVMSAVLSALNVPGEVWLEVWLGQWALAWPLAFVVSLILGAPVAKLSQWIARFPPRSATDPASRP